MSTHQSLRHRTDKPFPLSALLRLTPALDEFRLRYQALEPFSDDDQKLPFVPRLLNDPLILWLPERRPAALMIVLFFILKNFPKHKAGDQPDIAKIRHIIGLISAHSCLHKKIIKLLNNRINP